jgi:hypothetical protein
LLGSQRSLTWNGSGKEWTDKTHIERAKRLMTNWQIFYFSQQALYKSRRDLTSKTLGPSYNLSVLATLHSYCQCPWLSINFFLVKGNHLVFLPTMIETWCTCRFQPCWNATQPQRPCQIVDHVSQHPLWFIHAVTNGRISFFLKLNHIPLYLYLLHFLYSFIHWHLGCFCILTTANNSAMNTEVQIPLLHTDFHSFGYMPRSGIAG